MSFQINFNVLKGWPNPSIIEQVANEATGVTILEGMGGHLNASGQWVLGVSAANQQPFVFRNSTGDSDADHPFNAAQDYNQVNWGGIQGLLLTQPLWFQTSQFGGQTINVGDQLYIDTDGKFKTATDYQGNSVASGKIIVGICTRASHQGTGQNPPQLIDIQADGSKRTSS